MPAHKGNKNAVRLTTKDEHAIFGFAQVMQDLNAAWKPHKGQIEVGKALFQERKRIVIVQCGRKWGKTDFAVYALWLFALTHPGSGCYYIAPHLKQARDIVWDNFRLQSCGTAGDILTIEHSDRMASYVHKINESKSMITFKNGSYIKMDGAENFNMHRGTKPHFIVYEEAAFMDGRFDIVMRPNLGVYTAPMLVITTPPETENWYTDLVDEAKRRDDCFYKEAPWTDNKDNLPKALVTEIEWNRKLSIERGEYDKFQREYLGRFVLGGSNAIFPMVDPSLMRPHQEVCEEISLDRKKLQWFAIVDPGYITCFAVLFAAFNPYTKQVYWLDCIYEKEIGKMSDDQIWPRMVEIMMKLYPNSTLPTQEQLDINGGSDWIVVSDENPASFRRNIPSMFGAVIRASGKKPLKKEEGLSLIKDQFLGGRITVSKNCEPVITEMIKYIRDEHGNIPKKGDHLIDAVRYLNLALRYTFQMTKQIKNTDDPLDRIRNRQHFNQDIKQMRLDVTGHDLPCDWDTTTYDGDY